VNQYHDRWWLLCSRRKKQLSVATSGDVEHSSSSNYSVQLADDDVTDEAGTRLMVRLRRSDQLGFGFSAADERPTTIRSVIKGK